jgi:hypothetical protein
MRQPIAGCVQVALKAKFDYTVDELGRRREVVKSWEMFARDGHRRLTKGCAYNDRSELESEKMVACGETAVLIGRNLKFDCDLIGNRKTAESDQSKVSYASNGANQYESISGRRSMDVTGFALAGTKVYVEDIRAILG